MIRYDPLFRTLEKKNKRLIDLIRECGLSSGTVSKFNKNEVVKLDIIDRLCQFLKVPIWDVVEIELEDKKTDAADTLVSAVDKWNDEISK